MSISDFDRCQGAHCWPAANGPSGGDELQRAAYAGIGVTLPVPHTFSADTLDSFDGTEPCQILNFLQYLGLKCRSGKDFDRALELWRLGWESDVDPNRTYFDIDHTLIDSSTWALLFNCEKVSEREVLIPLAAMTMKHGMTLYIVTHATRVRLKVLVNHPNLALLRFVLTLKLPDAPELKAEDFEKYPRILTFESLAEKESRLLWFYGAEQLAGSEFSFDRKVASIIKNSLTCYKLGLKEFFRGLKTRDMLQIEFGDQIMFGVDDSPSQGRVFAETGGRLVQAPRKLKPQKDSTSYAEGVFDKLSFLAGPRGSPKTQLNFMLNAANTLTMPVAKVRYPHLFKMAWQGWVRPSLGLMRARMMTASRNFFRRFR